MRIECDTISNTELQHRRVRPHLLKEFQPLYNFIIQIYEFGFC